MNSTRKIAVTTGVVFIIATAAALSAASLVPSLTGTDYLTKLSASANQVAGAALLYLLAAFASVGIGATTTSPRGSPPRSSPSTCARPNSSWLAPTAASPTSI